MMEYLQDQVFLNMLDRVKVKTQYIRIIVLTFDEKEVRDIQGTIQSGSLNVNGNSAVRRTITLSMFADKETNNLTNLDNLISLNKKIKVQIGYKNPFSSYAKYGDIIWFPCGTFIISNATLSSSTIGMTINIQAKDKMAMLDGTAGGTLPANVSFHEIYELDDDNKYTAITHPTIYQIIQEAVNHFGNEDLNRIIISDLELETKMLVKYVGNEPIWFNDKHDNFVISNIKPNGYLNKYTLGDDVGYQMTDFTYPGELILSAGDTVASLLDKICKTLGNYEYFYDVNGNFIFQEIKNYLNTNYTPLPSLDSEDYIKVFSDTKFAYALTDSETVVTFGNSPKYSNIKNDFIVWGKRKTLSDAEVPIRYHLAIDEKPQIVRANKYMWPIYENGQLVRYEYTDSATSKPAAAGNMVGSPSDEWREELYRQALERQCISGNSDGSELVLSFGWYDEELIAEWRKLYNPLSTTFRDNWNAYGDLGTWTGWNPDVYKNPEQISYWLDFIDTSSAIGKYCVKQIGRRTKVINSADIKTVYNKLIPDVVFFENTGNLADLQAKFSQYEQTGQEYCLLTPNQMNYFSISSTGASCYDQIKEMLYQYLVYNTTITVSCLPRYYFEPNQIIYVKDSDSAIEGNFVISQFSLPLNYSGTMNITATEALVRV